MNFEEFFNDFACSGRMKGLLDEHYYDNAPDDKSEYHKWRAEDFKDDDKLNDFLDETDALLDAYDRLSDTSKLIVDGFGFCNMNDTITKLQDYAIDINKKAKADEKPVKNSPVRELAEKYVAEELGGVLGCNAIELSDKVKKTLTDAYEAYGEWILKQ